LYFTRVTMHRSFSAVITGLLFAFAAASTARAETFTVFAAASLKNALDEIIRAHEIRTKDKVVASYAASSALAKQIEQGAPADIFASADVEWMDYLEKRRLIQPSSRFNLVRNRLVLIAPADSRAAVKIARGFPLAAALGKDRLSIANPDHVPAGKYAKAALESLGVWKDVQTRVAGANDVRAALLLVARGETPFGIVYSTDAAVEPRVRVVDTFPESTHPPIVYPAALTVESRSAAALGFLSSLREPPARALFEKYRFR
jgi:molybdate transport system substrate-binding protein